jgi:hypothetical protein
MQVQPLAMPRVSRHQEQKRCEHGAGGHSQQKVFLGCVVLDNGSGLTCSPMRLTRPGAATAMVPLPPNVALNSSLHDPSVWAKEGEAIDEIYNTAWPCVGASLWGAGL